LGKEKSYLTKSSRGRRVRHVLVLATGPQDRDAKENREGGRPGWFRKEKKIRPKTIERIEKNSNI
jgi:hypothetical protein